MRKASGDVEVRARPSLLLLVDDELTPAHTRRTPQALRTDLAEFLASVPSVSKPAQGQVILRGDWVREVKEWLAARGF